MRLPIRVALLALLAQPVSAQAPDPPLVAGDRVRVTVYDEPTLSGEFVVNAGGTLSFPLIGDVAAAGLAPPALGRALQVRLADGYLVHPRVTVDVLSVRPFYILGEVGKAGEYRFSAGLTVLAAVATAQGFTYRANRRWVFVKHAGEETERRVRLTGDLRVEPGDTLRIGERYF